MKVLTVCPSKIQEQWYLVDAANVVLGRLASRVALLLQGKTDCYYRPQLMPKTHVIIINAEKIRLTGKKAKMKEEAFYYHTGYIGGIKSETYSDTLRGAHPERVVQRAIKRMLPKHSARARFTFKKNLRVYSGPSHPHAPQAPKPLDISSANAKNTIRN